MVALHPSDNAPIKEPLGIACRGGPVNGPFAAGALLTIKRILAERRIPITRIYAISGSVPAAALAAIGREDRACSIWARLTPQDIIDITDSWWSKAMTVSRIIQSESIFPSAGLERLIRNNIPAHELVAPGAIPLSVMTVDYLTGEPHVFNLDDPAYQPIVHEVVLGSMGLTPFLRLQPVWFGPRGFSPVRLTGEDSRLVLMDGGYRDNLMIERACRDGINTLLVVDINGLQVSPPPTYSWKHWSDPLQRAFHVLITTNDQRDLYGATRVNEELDIRDRLQKLASGLPEGECAELQDIIKRMDEGRLELGKKHPFKVHLVSEPKSVIPFDFANFKSGETEHLITVGHRAAQRTLDALK